MQQTPETFMWERKGIIVIILPVRYFNILKIQSRVAYDADNASTVSTGQGKGRVTNNNLVEEGPSGRDTWS
jgi:hypothetical protein